MAELIEMLALLEKRDAALLVEIERVTYTDELHRLRLPLPPPL